MSYKGPFKGKGTYRGKYKPWNNLKKIPSGNFDKKKKFYSHKKASSLLLKGPSIMPDKMRVKLKYSEVVNITPSFSYYQYVFAANDIYDPNYTSTGTQPTGRDQWAAFYSSYKVLGARIKCTFINNGTNYGIIGTLIPSLSNAPFTANDVNAFIRQPYSRTKLISSANGGGKGVLKAYFSSKKIFGEKTIDGQYYDADIGGPPANKWYYVLNFNTSDLATSISGAMIVEMTFYCEFSDRKSLTNS